MVFIVMSKAALIVGKQKQENVNGADQSLLQNIETSTVVATIAILPIILNSRQSCSLKWGLD